MENQQENTQIESNLKKHFTSVTPLSRYLALALFVALPFVGFWLGMEYAGTSDEQTENMIPALEQVNDEEKNNEIYNSEPMDKPGLDNASDKTTVIETVITEGHGEVSLLSSTEVSNQKDISDVDTACYTPEVEMKNVVLRHAEAEFSLGSIGIPKKVEGKWQKTKTSWDMGLGNITTFEFEWSPIVQIGKNTFLVPDYSSVELKNEVTSINGGSECNSPIKYDVFYMIGNGLQKDDRDNGTISFSDLVHIYLLPKAEGQKFCFGGCG